MKKTIVLGASTNPGRYAYTAVSRLKAAGHEVVPIGIREGEILGTPIIIFKSQLLRMLIPSPFTSIHYDCRNTRTGCWM